MSEESTFRCQGPGQGPQAQVVSIMMAAGLTIALVLPAATAAPLPAADSYQAGQAGEWHLIGPARLAQHGALPFSSEDAQEFRQRKDNTCALAALRFWLATQSVWTSEKGLKDLLAARVGSAANRVMERGYSVADFLFAARSFGFTGAGHWLTPAGVDQLVFPATALLASGERPHFLVLVNPELVFDPTMGYRELRIAELVSDPLTSVVVITLRTTEDH